MRRQTNVKLAAKPSAIAFNLWQSSNNQAMFYSRNRLQSTAICWDPEVMWKQIYCDSALIIHLIFVLGGKKLMYGFSMARSKMSETTRGSFLC